MQDQQASHRRIRLRHVFHHQCPSQSGSIRGAGHMSFNISDRSTVGWQGEFAKNSLLSQNLMRYVQTAHGGGGLHVAALTHLGHQKTRDVIPHAGLGRYQTSLNNLLVPETGIEPVRPLSGKRRILSPLCLPISPLRQRVFYSVYR